VTKDGQPSAHRGSYAYAIVAADGRPPDRAGIDGRSTVRIHTHRELGLAVSDVDLALFDGVEDDLTGAGSLGLLVHRHEAVLCALLDQGPVLPMRFGTVLPSAGDATELLRRRYDELTANLERLRGRREWRLRITMPSSRDGTAENHRDLDPTAKGAGTAYLSRRRRELDQQAANEERVREAIQRADIDLRRHAAGAVRRRGRDATLSFAYLVECSAEDRFVEQARLSVDDLDLVSCTAHLGGPWPAYSFASDAAGGPADD